MGAAGTKESMVVAAAEGKARNGSAPAVMRLARKIRTERERKETRVNSSTDRLDSLSACFIYYYKTTKKQNIVCIKTTTK